MFGRSAATAGEPTTANPIAAMKIAVDRNPQVDMENLLERPAAEGRFPPR